MSDNRTIELLDSTIDPTAQLHDYSTVIRCNIAEGAMVGKFSKITYSTLGRYSYTGDFTIVINSDIGNFCSISWGVSIGPEEHDYRRITNHSFLYSIKSFKLTKEKHYSPFERPCIIENDVWIGCNATILRGIKVGNGAVIGANSLVNKDVPPYAIVVGSPARIVKYRFSPEIIDTLEKLKWWELPSEFISEHSALFGQDASIESITKLKGFLKT